MRSAFTNILLAVAAAIIVVIFMGVFGFITGFIYYIGGIFGQFFNLDSQVTYQNLYNMCNQMNLSSVVCSTYQNLSAQQVQAYTTATNTATIWSNPLIWVAVAGIAGIIAIIVIAGKIQLAPAPGRVIFKFRRPYIQWRGKMQVPVPGGIQFKTTPPMQVKDQRTVNAINKVTNVSGWFKKKQNNNNNANGGAQ